MPDEQILHQIKELRRTIQEDVPHAKTTDVAVLNDLIRSSARVILAHVIQIQKPTQTIEACLSEANRELHKAYTQQTF
jgi:hypothetical protein